MTAATIHRLANCIPDDVLPDFFPGGRVPEYFAGNRDRKLAKFVLGYKDVAFGWKFAQVFARNNLELPPLPGKGEDAILQAYLYCRDTSYGSESFLQAMSLTSPERANAAKTVRALLIPRDACALKVAQRLRMAPHAVRLYEQLFFNVRDRRDDVIYIRDIVFPATRVSEMLRTEFQSDEVADMLLRAGYDNGVDDVIHMAGLADHTERMLNAASESSRQFEALLMANAVVQANNGFLNLKRTTPALQKASQLMIAGKISGSDSGDINPMAAVGESIMNELLTSRLTKITDMEAIKHGTPVTLGIDTP